MMPYKNNYHGAADARLWLVLAFLLAAPGVVWGAQLRVTVEGVKGVLRDNVLAYLRIYQERENRDLSPASIRRLHDAAPSEIRTALQPFGYYRSRLNATLNQDESGWLARYDIEVGEPIPVAVLDVQVLGEGSTDPEFRRLLDEFPLTLNGALDQTHYEAAKRNFQRVAAERGYFDQRFTRHEIQIDLDAYKARVYLHVDTGRRYRFGKIDIEQDVLDPELLAKYIRVSSGQPYSSAALLELQTTLSGTDYFGNVEVIADHQTARDYAVPIRVRLAPRKPSKYTFGLGYGTDTGPRGQIGWERRYLNPEGHHIRAELRGSKIERTVNAGYFIPIRNPRTDQLAITGGYTQTDINETETEVRKVAVSRTTLRGHLQETISLTRQNEKFAIGSETGAAELLLPGVTWSYLWGDERIYARQGARLGLDLRGAHEDLWSNASLGQARFQTKAIYSLADFGRVIGRVEVGATHIEEFGRLPVSLRFFAGGDLSVRGYDYNSLGPRNAEGTVTGGKHLLVGSLEYEQRITGDWSAAVFYDAGNAMNDFNEPLKKGAGLGLRWRSPVGQIRLDVASPLTDPDNKLRLHLYIGPDL